MTTNDVEQDNTKIPPGLFLRGLSRQFQEDRLNEAVREILDALYLEYEDATGPDDLPDWYFEMIRFLEDDAMIILHDERLSEGWKR